MDDLCDSGKKTQSELRFSNFRIDKDVQRCDRNLPYFLTLSNLEKLRNIITTYVWENLDIGYMQVKGKAALPHAVSSVHCIFKVQSNSAITITVITNSRL